MLKPSDLKQTQSWAIRDVWKQRRAGITSDCGFGKTIVGLSVARLMWVRKKLPTLVVGNAKAVKGAWKLQYKEWEHTKNLKVQILVGTPNERLHLLNQQAHIYVISYNSLKWLAEHNKHKFGLVIADEATSLKGGTSSWRKELEKLSKHALIRLALTATPKTREEDDYFGLAHWLDGGKALGETITTFRERYMKSFQLPKGGVVWSMRNKECSQEVRDRVQHLFIEYPLTDSSEVNIIEKRMYGTLSPDSMALYDRFKETGVLAGHDIKDGRPLSSVEIVNLTSQLSSGFIYDDTQMRISVAQLKEAKSALDLLKKKKRQAIVLFDDRVKFLNKMINRINKNHDSPNILICYYFKHELEQLQQALPGAVPDTSSNFEQRWNEGKIKYGLLQYNRSSKSVNLQKGGYIMAAYSQTFSWEDWYQIIRRLARQGQTAEDVYFYILHMRGTTDDLKQEKMSGRNIGHKKFQQMIMKEVRNK